MVQNSDQQNYENNLLKMIIEQLKRPLLAISNESEILKKDYAEDRVVQASHSSTQHLAEKLEDFRTISRNSLELIDNFILSYGKQAQAKLAVDIEPVILSSVLGEVVAELEHYGSLYGCRLEVVGSTHSDQPVLANKDNLKAVLKLLSSSFIEVNGSNQAEGESGRVILATKKTVEEVEVGVFSPALKLSSQELSRARGLVGKANQLMPSSFSSIGVNIMLAETLEVDGSNSQFALSNFRGLNGFSKKLIKSKQLQLVSS
jgi:hypothetical protein